ncbi:hypothetical protein GCM10010442_34260 [Kitasatospora kifunensis]
MPWVREPDTVVPSTAGPIRVSPLFDGIRAMARVRCRRCLPGGSGRGGPVLGRAWRGGAESGADLRAGVGGDPRKAAGRAEHGRRSTAANGPSGPGTDEPTSPTG